MRNNIRIIALLLSLTAWLDCFSADRWTTEKANQWYNSQPWLVGCDYIPATAINQIEMWSAKSFDTTQIAKELTWAEDLGFNTLRVFLSSVVWQHDGAAMKGRIDRFLTLCSNHGIRPILVFFDDCWNPESHYGVQPKPQPGIHNSGWVQDPAVSLRSDTAALYPFLRSYMNDIMRSFGNDSRILMWDLYNEPGNKKKGNVSLPLMIKVFEWAREIAPSQPITIGVWNKDLGDYNRYCLDHSDIITYHCYGTPEIQQRAIDTLSIYGRPLICTEYMARPKGCTFQNTLPLLKENHVGALNWGFVAGKTNTIFTWRKPEPDMSEPVLWFHDIYRQNGSAFDEKEVSLIKELTGIEQ